MKPLARDGAFIGGLAALALAAVSYLGWKLAGLPFAPFDVFDSAVRAVPGSVATFGVESTIAITRVLHLASTAAAAKTAEQTLAVAAFVALGVVAGAGLYAVLRYSDEPALLVGVTFGAVLGGMTLFVERGINRIGSGALADDLWVIGTFLGWGAVVGGTYDRLRSLATRSIPTDGRGVERRRFLMQAGGAVLAVTGVSTVCGVLVARWRRTPLGERWSASHALPNAAASVAPVPGTRQEFTALESHYRIDTVTRVPVINASRWRLRIGGLVEQRLELTLDDLRQFEPMHQFVTLSCVSNPVGGDLIGTTRWTGVSLQGLLPRLGLKRSATHLRIRSADGFFEVIPVDAFRRDARVMLAYAWDGLPLPVEHGFPLRIYIPDVYGMKQPKWIDAIDAVDRWEPGYWVARGWDPVGQMKATSVIDVVAAAAPGDGQAMRALVGGIAHAGVRRVSTVDVRVDGGEWRRAELREPLSDATWVLWRADVVVAPGDHEFTVRCSEGDGAPQTDGFHTKRSG